MAISLPPMPYKVPVTDDAGYMSQAWTGWFREVFTRIGGNVAPSIADISTSLASLQSQITTQGDSITALETPSEELNQGPVL